MKAAALAMLLALAGCATVAPNDADAPYLTADALDIRQLLAGPPASGSRAEVADVAAFFALRADPVADPARFGAARADAAAYDSAVLLPLFIPGAAPRAYPATLHLLDRLSADLAQTVGPAKAAFAIPRPYRRFALPATCDPLFGPAAPDRHGLPSGAADSYPSGHAARGWSAALQSARASEILARGQAYGDNRAVCGVHTPADIAAGRLLATALVTQLKADPGFQRDLAAAAAEFY